MNTNFFTGKLVRLTTLDPDKDSALLSRWNFDSEYARLLDGDIAYLWTPKQIREFIEKEEGGHFFMIRTMAEDQPIGMINLSGFNWVSGDCFVGIGLGEREYWGKGYGSEAMNLILGYGFRQLNLHRVSLDVFEYNPRAVRSYEKCGFQHEGRVRGALNRDGHRWDLIFMGILREEWEALQGDQE
jgi:RimJ/RimL family protein N-acetyltransferase